MRHDTGGEGGIRTHETVARLRHFQFADTGSREGASEFATQGQWVSMGWPRQPRAVVLVVSLVVRIERRRMESWSAPVPRTDCKPGSFFSNSIWLVRIQGNI